MKFFWDGRATNLLNSGPFKMEWPGAKRIRDRKMKYYNIYYFGKNRKFVNPPTRLKETNFNKWDIRKKRKKLGMVITKYCITRSFPLFVIRVLFVRYLLHSCNLRDRVFRSKSTCLLCLVFVAFQSCSF